MEGRVYLGRGRNPDHKFYPLVVNRISDKLDHYHTVHRQRGVMNPVNGVHNGRLDSFKRPWVLAPTSEGSLALVGSSPSPCAHSPSWANQRLGLITLKRSKVSFGSQNDVKGHLTHRERFAITISLPWVHQSSESESVCSPRSWEPID